MNISKFNETIQLRTLISICKLIFSNERDNQIIEDAIDAIGSFENDLTKEELKLPLSDKLFQVKSNKEFIQALLVVFYNYLGIGEESRLESFKLYFGAGDYEIVVDEVGNSNFDKLFKEMEFSNHKEFTSRSFAFKVSIQFANFKLLEYSLVLDPELVGIELFSHCLDRDKQIKFIDAVNKDIKVVDLINRRKVKPVISPNYFIYLLIGYDDLELIQYFYSNLCYPMPFIYQPCTVNEFIKSNEMLDYVFHHTRLDLSNNNILQFKDSQLLKHYETLLKKKYIKDNGENGNGVKIIISSIKDPSPEVLNYIIESGLLLYEFSDSVTLHQVYYEICSVGYYKSEFPNKKPILETLKTFFYNFQFSSNSLIKFDYSKVKPEQLVEKSNYNLRSNSNFIKFLDWLYCNHHDHLITFREQDEDGNIIDKNSAPTIDPFLLVLISRFDQIPVGANIIRKTLLFNNTGMNIKLLDYILKNITSTNFILFFNRVLIDSSRQGKLHIFQFIYQNYGWMLSPNQIEGHPKPNRAKDLKSLLFRSLRFGHLELSEFLFEIFLKISQKEFVSYSSFISAEYFKNKYF